MTFVWMFPGQSSRYVGMIEKLAALHAPNRDLLGHASELLGRDLLACYASSRSDEEMFATNRDVQIGVFLANHMFLQILQGAGIVADYSLGLSLGEWNHIVHIGALSFEEALLAVEQRGLAYDAGPRGAMASVFPASVEDLEPILKRAGKLGIIEAVNLNSPRQQVISGETAALEEAIHLIEEELFLQPVVIERQVPMHASMFRPAGEQFRAYLSSLSFKTPHLPYLPNRLGHIQEAPTQEDFVELLSSHVYRPVLWRHSIDFLVAQHPDAVLVEVGPKGVLFNLLDRRWHRDIRKFKMDSAQDTAAHQSEVLEALRALGHAHAA
ncbi:MAG: ACP S-malonyltransferase [Myxococcales bacterium]|nr:ACP S-malonyltransferase [Myxococcales bacterium]